MWSLVFLIVQVLPIMSDFKLEAVLPGNPIILTPRIRLSCCVTKKSPPYMMHPCALHHNATGHGSHGLSALRARRTKSRGPKGLQLEVGPRSCPRLIVAHNLVWEQTKKMFVMFLLLFIFYIWHVQLYIYIGSAAEY